MRYERSAQPTTSAPVAEPAAERERPDAGQPLRSELDNEIERMFTILDAARSDMESGLRYLARNRDNLTATQRRAAAGLQRAYLKTNNSREACQRKWLERAGQWPDGELSARLADLRAHNARLRDNAAGLGRRIDELTGGRHRPAAVAGMPLPPSPEAP